MARLGRSARPAGAIRASSSSWRTAPILTAQSEPLEEILALKAQGLSDARIAEHLNAAGRRPNGKARPWSRSAVRTIRVEAAEWERVEKIRGTLAGGWLTPELEPLAVYVAEAIDGPEGRVGEMAAGLETRETTEEDRLASALRRLGIGFTEESMRGPEGEQVERLRVCERDDVLRLALKVGPRMADTDKRRRLCELALSLEQGEYRIEHDLLERIQKRAAEGTSPAEIARVLNQAKYRQTYPPAGGSKEWSERMVTKALQTAEIAAVLREALL